MAIAKIDDLRQRIRDALRSADFQATALSLRGPGLKIAVARLFKIRNIGVTLISVEPAETAALADFAVVWTSPIASKNETNWFSFEGVKR
ncbi:MAG: hypothetical protein ABIO40_08740 [Devosia sp.]